MSRGDNLHRAAISAMAQIRVNEPRNADERAETYHESSTIKANL
jgi:hypothetical protein